MSKGTATEITICGCRVRLGDEMKVRYTTGERMKGATIEGKVVELWDEDDAVMIQGRLSCGWCFHDGDEVLVHKEAHDAPTD